MWCAMHRFLWCSAVVRWNINAHYVFSSWMLCAQTFALEKLLHFSRFKSRLWLLPAAAGGQTTKCLCLDHRMCFAFGSIHVSLSACLSNPELPLYTVMPPPRVSWGFDLLLTCFSSSCRCLIRGTGNTWVQLSYVTAVATCSGSVMLFYCLCCTLQHTYTFNTHALITVHHWSIPVTMSMWAP